MRKSAIIGPICLASLLTACAPSAETLDRNLECAALISAASQLSARGELDTGSEFDSKALFSGMMHLNTYAIPNQVGEGEAFEQLNSRRDSLIETTSPSNILSLAKSCIRKTPQQ